MTTITELLFKGGEKTKFSVKFKINEKFIQKLYDCDIKTARFIYRGFKKWYNK